MRRRRIHRSSDYFSAETAYALELLQAHLGVTENGTLELGQAVFFGRPHSYYHDQATLGSPVGPGQKTRAVRRPRRFDRSGIALDADQQSEVKVGDEVTITLPKTTRCRG